MPSLSLTKNASNGLAHDASHVNTPFTEVETWANTTKLDYLNIQDDGLRTTGLRTHANVESVRIKVRNSTGSTIAAGALVYFSGTYSDGTDSYPTITKAVTTTAANTTFFAQATTTAAIGDGADGTAAVFLELTGQNTSSGTVGDLVYLDTTAGGWTRTRPTGGQYVQVVGTITVVNASSGRVVLSLGSVPEHLTGGSSGLGATFQTLTVQGASGAAADVYHISDAGEDNADKWKISVADGGNRTWENYTSGSYAAKLTLTSAGALTVAGALNIGSVSAAGSDTDKFLVLDSSGNVDYRTGAEVLSDIGGQASGSYISHDGSTANGVLTYKDADEATVEANLTFDGSTLAITGSIDLSADIDVDGTLEADAITLGGTALGSLYSPIAGSSSIVTTGALNSGSITSGFGTINNGSSTITTTGALSAGATTVTSLNASDGNITNVGNIALDTISSDAGTTVSVTLGTDAGDDFVVGNNNALVVEGDNDRVGIGTTSPDTAMHIYNGSAGSVTAISGAALTIEDDAASYLQFLNPADTEAGIIFGRGTDNNHAGMFYGSDEQLYFSANNAERWRITSTGQLTASYGGLGDIEYINVNTGTNAYASPKMTFGSNTSSSASTNGEIRIHQEQSAHANYRAYVYTQSSSNTQVFRVMGDGDVENANNSYGSTSDLKLKQDITDARSYWDNFKALQFKKFRFKKDVAEDENAGYRFGLIAQDVESIFPSLVKDNTDLNLDGTPTDTVTKSIKYSVLSQIGLRVVQELQTRLEAAESKIAALESA